MRGHLLVDQLSIRYPRSAAPVVHGLRLELAPGELVCLLGPSGSGKTSILRCIAGFLEPAQGAILLDGQELGGVPPERRGTVLVFQQPTLFPHLTVEENVAFGPRMQGRDKATRLGEARALLGSVQLAGYERRYPHELSGGQRQRVAFARALAARPRVLLLDEPFASLDPALRDEMRSLVRQLQREQRLTTLLVTHDQQEAALLGDRIALLLDGQLAQVGPPEALYARPATLAVARFFGVQNMIPGMLAEDGRTVSTALGPLLLAQPHPAPGPVILLIRPEHIRLQQAAGAGVAARVQQRDFLGLFYRYTLRAGALTLVALAVDDDHQPGDTVQLSFPPQHLWALAAEG